MTTPVNRKDPPLAKPGEPPTGDADRAGASSAVDAGATRNDDDEDEWRHEPVAPVDEPNPIRSLGKAVGDVITGSGPKTPAPPKR